MTRHIITINWNSNDSTRSGDMQILHQWKCSRCKQSDVHCLFGIEKAWSVWILWNLVKPSTLTMMLWSSWRAKFQDSGQKKDCFSFIKYENKFENHVANFNWIVILPHLLYGWDTAHFDFYLFGLMKYMTICIMFSWQCHHCCCEKVGHVYWCRFLRV